MTLMLILTQTLETLRVSEDLTPLLSKRGKCRGERLLPGYTDLQDLFGFFASRYPAKRREAEGHAIRILSLAHPVAFRHPKERFDRIGTDRQADLIEPQCGGALDLILEISRKLPTQGDRGHLFNQRFTLCQGGRREPLGFEDFLAGQQSARIALKPLDEGFASDVPPPF